MTAGREPARGLWEESERRRLVRLCVAITGDRDAAEDLAQETLLEGWRHRDRLLDARGSDRWLAAIARNVCRRWSRERGRQRRIAAAAAREVVVADSCDPQLDHVELSELIARGLSLVPPAAREVLRHRYVDDLTQDEIAARLGISADAVAMRLSRGLAALREGLSDERGDGWSATRVWCVRCGSRRLEMQRDPRALAFRCRGCSARTSASFDLTNPFFAGLLDDVVQPASAVERIARWSSTYFQDGVGDAPCTRCHKRVALVRSVRGQVGLAGTCRECGEQVWSSLLGLAELRPEIRALRRRRPRLRRTREWTVERNGVSTVVIRFESTTSTDAAEVAIELETLRAVAV